MKQCFYHAKAKNTNQCSLKPLGLFVPYNMQIYDFFCNYLPIYSLKLLTIRSFL